MKLSINFDFEDNFCYFVHDSDSGDCWNLPPTIANIDEAIAYTHDEYPLADIVVGDSALEN